MENLSIKIEGNQKELLFKTGIALPEKEPKIISILGNILAPGEWLSVRSANAKKDHVQFSRNKMQIKFSKNERDHYSETIIGELKVNEDLVAWGINTDKTWSSAALGKFLKMNRLFFANKDECARIVLELNSLKAKIQSDIEQIQDTRGNNRQMVQTIVESNIPLKFKLKLPIFNGFKEKIFIVEICVETSATEVQLWLESAELNEIIMGDRDSIMNTEIAKFKAAGVPVIEL